MNQYKQQAKQLIGSCKPVIIPTILFISLVQVLRTGFSDDINTLLSILTICLNYGYVSIARKVVNGKGNEVQVVDDGIIGIRKYFKLISTYLSVAIATILPTLIIFALMCLITTIFMPSTVKELISLIQYRMFDSHYFEETITELAFPILITSILMIISLVYAGILFSGSEYMIEHGYTGFKAVNLSKICIKGHKKEYISIYLNHALEFLIVIGIGGLMGALIGSQVTSPALLWVVPDVIVSLAMSYFILPSLIVSKYLFFDHLIKEKGLGKYKKHEDALLNSNLYIEEVEDLFKQEEKVKEMNTNKFEKISSTKLLLGCLLFVPVYLYIGQRVLSAILLSIPLFRNMASETLNAWYNLIFDGTLVIAAIILFREYFKNPFKKLKAAMNGHSIKFTLKGMGLIYGVEMVAHLIVSLITGGGSTSANQEAIASIFQKAPIQIIIVTVICAPILEEVIFRGLIFRFVRQWNKYLAILISGFTFGFVHVASEVLVHHNFGEMIQILPYFFMGMLLAYYYEKHKTIAVPMYFHFLNNSVAMIAMLISLLF